MGNNEVCVNCGQLPNGDCDICNGFPGIVLDLIQITTQGTGSVTQESVNGLGGCGYNIPNPKFKNHAVSGYKYCDLCGHWHSGRCKT